MASSPQQKRGLSSHGGKRRGAGRKRKHSKGVAHRTRETVKARYPLHVNFKLAAFVRHKRGLAILKRAILNARKQGLRVLHFSLQTNHVHLYLEAQDTQTLTRGMRSLTVTFAKGLGKGRIQRQRYHLHVLRTLRAARNALHYVIFNEQKHTGLKRAHVTSPYCSLRWARDLRGLARRAGMSVVLNGAHVPREESWLDGPASWLARTVEVS